MPATEHDACIRLAAKALTADKAGIGSEARAGLTFALLDWLGYPRPSRPALVARIADALAAVRPAIVIESMIRQAFGEVEEAAPSSFQPGFNAVFGRA